MDWALSAITILQAVMAGNRHRAAWMIGLCGQTLWVVWIVVGKHWGFLPLTLFLTVIYVRNHLRWNA